MFVALHFLVVPLLEQQAGEKKAGVDVPDITLLKPDQARKILAASGLLLVVTERKEHPKVSEGLIASQTPLEGSNVKNGAQVEVVISTGIPPVRIIMPDLAKLPVIEAIDKLKKAGLGVVTMSREIHDEIPKDRVISAKPVPGQEVEPEITVELVVSDGAAGIEVPDFTRRKLKVARRMIKKLGFTVGDVSRKEHAEARAGVVLSQNPKAETSAKKGTPIDLVVNTN